MGGCASKPKESDIPPKSLPTEAPVSPKKEEAKTVAQESNVGESQKEAPLVDLSEPKEEAVEVETVSIEAKPEVVVVETVSIEAKPEVVEVIPEAVVEAKPAETVETEKQEEIIPEAVVEAKPAETVETEKQEEPKVEVAAEAEEKVEVVAEAKEKVEVVAEAEEKVEAAAEKPKEQPVLEAPKEEKASDATPTPTTQEERASDAPLVTEA